MALVAVLHADATGGTDSPAPPPLARLADPVGADGQVQIDLPCRRCAYNLRSLPRGGRCPECHLPVRASLRYGDLAFSEPQYVRRLAVGAHLLLVGSLATAGWMFALSSIAALDVATRFVFAAVASAGAWLLATPDPSGLGEDDYGVVRRIARTLLPSAGLAVFPLVAYRRATADAALASLLGIGITLACVAGFAGLIALMQYLRRLGLRMGNATVAAQMKLCLRGMLLSVPTLGLVVAGLTTVGALPRAVESLLWVLAIIAGLGVLFSTIAFVAATWTLARALAADARIARQAWSEVSS